MHVHSKSTNSFTYVLPATCYPRKSVNNIPRDLTPQFRRIFDSDKKSKHQSEENINYLTVRDYHPR